MIGFYVDRRCGLTEQWVYGDTRKAHMRVPDRALRSVVFLAVENNGQFHYGGTAFLVGCPSRHPNSGHTYLLTARHNIEKAKQVGKLFLRVNLVGGGAEMVEIDSPHWRYPENEASDVAVLPIF